MFDSLKEPPTTRPPDGWTDRQIAHAKGILLNIPDLDQPAHRKLQFRQIGIFGAFIAVAFLLALVHPALVIVAFVASLFVLDFSFVSHATAQRKLHWAREVLEEVENSADVELDR